MKKFLKILGIILLIMVLIVIIFYTVNCSRIKNNQNSMFYTSRNQKIDNEEIETENVFVIGNNFIKNLYLVENFIKNTNYYNSEKQSDKLNIITYTREGDKISIEIEYIKENNIYKVKRDNTQDRYANEQSKKIEENEYSAAIYSLAKEQVNDMIQIKLTINNLVETVTKYEEVEICSYPANLSEGESFFGTIVESNQKYIIVEPYENENIKKTSDKFVINLGNTNDIIYEKDTNVKITHTGFIKETYPAQLDVIDIEIKSTDKFELVFEARKDLGIKTIINKDETVKYTYNIKSYGGDVYIIINEQKMQLREALVNNKITMDEILAKLNKESNKNNIEYYNDGGSIIYRHEDYSVLKFHTVSGNRDVYIGISTMKINNVEGK